MMRNQKTVKTLLKINMITNQFFKNNHIPKERSKANLIKDKENKLDSRSINLTKTKTYSENLGENIAIVDHDPPPFDRTPLNVIKWNENTTNKIDFYCKGNNI